jgi:DNA-binding CsgD family transcriptional regulator
MRASEVLDHIASCGEAVYAIDHTNRIILWNRECEDLLGFSSHAAVGKHCYELLSGRDIYDNYHCHRHCPVTFQIEECPREKVNPYVLELMTAAGRRLAVVVNPVVIRLSPESPPVLVHLLTPAEIAATAPADRAREAKEAIRRERGRERREESEAVSDLTRREIEILSALAAGYPTTEIAARLAIAPVTVRNHVQKILHKLAVHNRSAAVARAYQAGLIAD